MGNNWARTNMRKSFYFVASLALTCILFVGCKKWIEEPEPENPVTMEDLSYLIKTYQRYESNGHIYKTTWTYDGYKPTGYQQYVDGQLNYEEKNYSYNGLNASWDLYYYQNNEVTSYSHYETEYLDETFLRTKYRKVQHYNPNNPQNNYITEYFVEYNGKKKMGHELYRNGILESDSHYNYDGLRCSYRISFYLSQGVVHQTKDIDIVYLDDTYLRDKTYKCTIKYYENGVVTKTNTNYFVNDFEGKKTIGSQSFYNGKLRSVSRDYHYDGLSCYYFADSYQDGEVVSTTIHEIEYLE